MAGEYRYVKTPDGDKKVANAEAIFVGIGVLNAEVDGGRVYAEMTSGRYWRVRRNGATQLWKRDLNRFRIPVKAGLRGYAAIENGNLKHFWIAVD